MNDNKNMLLAIVLSALVLFGWSFVAEKFFPTPKAAPQAQAPAAAPAGQVQPTAGGTASAALRPRAQVIASTPRVRINTPALSGSINLKGARIDDVVMLKHRSSEKPNS
ncbi:MAG: membrane protein insertase YidC, partial [Sphingomicrobium sp.]